MSAVTPIFVHSLFRAGSTYVFNCFRRSPNGYWCFQEPLNEYIHNAATCPDALLKLQEDNAKHLRHPAMDRPYFYEFFPLAPQIRDTFHPEFSYDEYFSDTPSETDALCHYLSGLAEGAKGRPVFQECRSAGRVSAIRRCLGGTHLFLWRNPWDQWWSYKVDSHFEICNLQILAAKHAPAPFLELRERFGFVARGRDIGDFVGQRLNAAGSYTLFFALWCHAMLEARPRCDFALNIDSLSLDEDYRTSLLRQMELHNVAGVDFSDCAIPMGIYGQEDIAFFNGLEQHVIEIFLRHGYSSADLEEVRLLREQHYNPRRTENTPPKEIEREFERLRHLARRLETELSDAQRARGRLIDDLTAQELKREALASTLEIKEAEREALAEALSISEKALSLVLNSRYWRWGKPVRIMGAFLRGRQGYVKKRDDDENV